MKKLITIVFVFFTVVVYAQPEMKFAKLKHDYGNITQEAGDAYFDFVFTNSGNQPIVLNDVDASCGCTEPIWDEKPVLPGKTGIIKVGYDPYNSPGHFSKTITVYSNAKNSPVVLTITGNVVEKQNSLAEQYPKTIGDLNLSTNYINFGNTFNNQIKKYTIKIYNPTNNTLNIQIKDSDKPSYVKIVQQTKKLQPEKSGTIEIEYDASKVNDWDLVNESIYLTINNKTIKNEKISLSAVIKEKYTAEILIKPPKIELSEKSIDFGSVNTNSKQTKKITFKNIGDSELIIRKIDSKSTNIKAKVTKNNIAPGKTGTIEISFNSNNMTKNVNSMLTIITNSPSPGHNKVIISVKGNITTK